MFTPFIPCIILIVASLGFGFLPFIGEHRSLPRWIRLALLMIALCLFTGGAVFFAAHFLFPFMHRLLVFIALVLGGMGMGIILLLTVSGEYVRAVRDLNTGHSKRSANTREESGHEPV
jgi:hypothetical protein